jgi:biopolymer transport protein ExbD
VRLQRKGNLKKARIEIIPMIDTIFFLLVFFMISTLSMSRFTGVQVNLPKAASGSQPPTEAIVISLNGMTSSSSIKPQCRENRYSHRCARNWRRIPS